MLIDGELVLKEEKVYVLKNVELRVKIIIIWLYYIIPGARYGGRWKIMVLVTKNYWWPEVTNVKTESSGL